MLKAVLDTNVFISSIFWKGNPYKLIEKALDKKMQVFVTTESLEELEKVLRRDFKEPEDIIQRQLDFILSFAYMVKPKEVGNIIKEDPDDNKILRCAASINADYVVSGDQHLLRLGRFKKTKIVSPKELVDICK